MVHGDTNKTRNQSQFPTYRIGGGGGGCVRIQIDRAHAHSAQQRFGERAAHQRRKDDDHERGRHNVGRAGRRHLQRERERNGAAQTGKPNAHLHGQRDLGRRRPAQVEQEADRKDLNRAREQAPELRRGTISVQAHSKMSHANNTKIKAQKLTVVFKYKKVPAVSVPESERSNQRATADSTATRWKCPW
jgi:hypothetical protein